MATVSRNLSKDFSRIQTDSNTDVVEQEGEGMELLAAVEPGRPNSENGQKIQSTSSGDIVIVTPSTSPNENLHGVEAMDIDSTPVTNGCNESEGCSSVDGSNYVARSPSISGLVTIHNHIDKVPSSTTPGVPNSSPVTMTEFLERCGEVAADKPSTSITYPVYVKSLQEAENVLHRFEGNTKTRFCVWRCPKDFGTSKIGLKGKRLYWHEFIIEDRVTVKSNGVPFVMMGRKVYDCHHGRDRNMALKQKAMLKRQEVLIVSSKTKDFENDVKKRNVTTPSRKVDCPARVVFCEIVYFPDYKLETDTKHYRNLIAKTMRRHFTEGLVNLENIDRRIYLCFPLDTEHKGHPIGQLDSKLFHRVDPKISSKITQLVSTGVTNDREMKHRLDEYITRELFPARAKPFHSNRRYYPNRNVIRLKTYNAIILKCLSLIDLENIEEALPLWTSNASTDKFFLRQYKDVDESLFNGTKAVRFTDEDQDEIKIREQVAKEQFLFVHQTAFQRHLMKRYGDHVVFLDPMYRTAKYSVPVFLLTVKTNCDHQIVASFVVQNESKESIMEALAFLKAWNPDWTPKIFMVDNDVEEINAVGETFPGCKVLLSDFHREQSWDRWLSLSANDVAAHKNVILVYLRRLAAATSVEEFKTALDMLRESDIWNCDYGNLFRNWFEDRWLSVEERWVWFYKVGILSSVLTVNNTLEWQNKEFIHEQLTDNENTPLSDLLKILIGTILPAKRKSYLEQNGHLSDILAKYPNLPTLFHGRPRQFLEHLVERITTTYDITSEDIVGDTSDGGVFLVRSCDSDREYSVDFGDKERLPHCNCDDWLNTMLPCNHFVAIMRNFEDWNWSKFPESYRSSPYLTLDEYVKPNSCEVDTNITETDSKSTKSDPKLTERNRSSTDANPNSTEVNPSSTDVSASSTEVNPSSTDGRPIANEPDQHKGIASSAVSLDGNLVYELLLEKQGRKSTASRCRDLLSEINDISYVVHDRAGITSLMKALQDTLDKLRLCAVDDELVVPDTTEVEPVKSEVGKESRGSPQKRGKRTRETAGHSAATKSVKLDSHAMQRNISGSARVEDKCFGVMESLNIDYGTPPSGGGGTAGNTGGTAENTGGTAENTGDTQGSSATMMVNTGQPSEADPVVYKVFDLTQLTEKKDPAIMLSPSGTFSKYEESLIQRNEMLTQLSINHAQRLLHEAFQNLKGFQNVARGAVQAFEPVSGDFVQILHDGNLHWVCTSNVALGANKDPAAVSIYDSTNQGYIAKFTKQQLASFLCIRSAEIRVIMKSVQQSSAVDCGVFAIAYATALVFGLDPSKQRFDVAKMRPHLVECLKSKTMSPFPDAKDGAGDLVVSKRTFYTIELFCSCRMPYEKPKSEADLMAQCGSCKEWFHQRCEKIAVEIFKTSGLNFMCSSCLKNV